MSTQAKHQRRPPRHRLRLAVLVIVLLAARSVLAQSLATPTPSATPSVVVLPPQCTQGTFPLVPFLDSLRVELAGGGLACCMLMDSGGGMPTTASLRLMVEMVPCAPDADRVELSVQEPEKAHLVERAISLTDVVQTARPRALALAAAELIRSLGLGADRATAEALVVPVKAMPPSPAPAPPIAAPPLALFLRAEAEARSVPTRDTLMWGARLRLTALWRSLHWDLDLGASYATAQVELGEIQLRSASAGVGLGPRLATRNVIMDLGLHAELGWAWVHGETGLADVHTGARSDLISTIGLRVSLEFPARLQLRPSITLEGGGVLLGLRGDMNGQPVVGMTGYYLLAAVGMAVSL